MLWPILGSIFTVSIILLLVLAFAITFRLKFWKTNKSKILVFYAIWFVPYSIFILFFTGPVDLTQYPPQEMSPFKLPWHQGVTRFVSQGNRSFTSHRALHLCAWDFVMPIGTPVLAAGDGKVVQVEMNHDGIGYYANVITIEHPNGVRTGYAHLKKDSAVVKVGDHVNQGQMIALSGLTGQTPFPHLHFFFIGGRAEANIFQGCSWRCSLCGAFLYLRK